MNKIRKPRKELSIKILLLIILLFTFIYLFYGVCFGFLIDAIINFKTSELLVRGFFVLVVGIVYLLLLTILMRNSDSENVKPLKWYINNIMISLTINLIITSITVFTLNEGDGITNYLVGFFIFPFIGIISTPNFIKYVKHDTERWKKIFYKNGNLENIKKDKDYYRLKTPVNFENDILKSVYRQQLLNLLIVIAFMILIIYVGVHYMTTDHNYTNNLLVNISITRAKRSFGFIFLLMLLFLSFGIPIIAYYITNALKKIKVVRNHEYIAYHAIVNSVNNGKITIFNGSKRYNYNYCTCVGIKEKNVHNTPGVLIFIPDDVLFFSDENLK